MSDHAGIEVRTCPCSFAGCRLLKVRLIALVLLCAACNQTTQSSNGTSPWIVPLIGSTYSFHISETSTTPVKSTSDTGSIVLSVDGYNLTIGADSGVYSFYPHTNETYVKYLADGDIWMGRIGLNNQMIWSVFPTSGKSIVLTNVDTTYPDGSHHILLWKREYAGTEVIQTASGRYLQSGQRNKICKRLNSRLTFNIFCR